MQGFCLVMFATFPFFTLWNRWRFILECAIFLRVCCIMVNIDHEFCWFVWICNGFVLFWHTLGFILCYNIHEGPFFIVKVLHGYVALWLCFLIHFVTIWDSFGLVLLDSHMYQGWCCNMTFVKAHTGSWISLMVMLHNGYV